MGSSINLPSVVVMVYPSNSSPAVDVYRVINKNAMVTPHAAVSVVSLWVGSIVKVHSVVILIYYLLPFLFRSSANLIMSW